MDARTDKEKQRHYEAAKLRVLNDDNLSDKEKELVIASAEERTFKSEPLSWSRKYAIVSWLRLLLTWLNPDITEINQGNYKEHYTQLEHEIATRKKRRTLSRKKWDNGEYNKDDYKVDYMTKEWVIVQTDESYSRNSKADMRKEVKAFLNFLIDDKDMELPPAGKKYFNLTKAPDTVKDDDVLTPEEAEQFLAVVDNPMAKSYFSLSIYDIFRPHELRSLTIKDVHLEKDPAHIDVPESTKTGSRRVFIHEAIHPLAAWLAVHPKRKDKNAPVFMCQNGKSLSVDYSTYLVKKYFKKAELTKPARLYHLRHASYSMNVEKIGLDATKTKGGHKPSSCACDKYSHHRETQLLDAERQARGLGKNGNKPAPTTHNCFFCGAVNPLSEMSCYRCHRSLDKKAITESADTVSDMKERLNKLESLQKTRMEKLEMLMDSNPKVLEAIETVLNKG